MPTTMTWMELTPTAFGRSENTQPLSLVMRENEGQQFSKLQHVLRKNDPIPWSFHLVWMSFPCLTPLTHRSVPWWFNSLKRGSFHGIYHHLLIIYLWIPIHPIGFLGGWPLQPPPVGAFLKVARHTTLPGDGGSGPALQVRGVQVWNETIEGSTPRDDSIGIHDPIWSMITKDGSG